VNDGREIRHRAKKVDFEGVPTFGPPCMREFLRNERIGMNQAATALICFGCALNYYTVKVELHSNGRYLEETIEGFTVGCLQDDWWGGAPVGFCSKTRVHFLELGCGLWPKV
jgi:hypothetical protein